eukprot:PhM_4_TR11517/c0_g2_i1/m.40807/K00849/galK; galactokinase
MLSTFPQLASNATFSHVLSGFRAAFPDVSQKLQLFMSYAPGRINFLGEHVDYMGGSVLPAAVDLGTYYVAVFCPGGNDFTTDVICVNSNERNTGGWKVYLDGIVKEMVFSGPNGTLKVAFGGDVPIGSGMSSSAALCVGYIFLLQEVLKRTAPNPAQLSSLDIAVLARRIEVEYAKVNIGIMDQYVSVHGEEHKFLELDCNKLTHVAHDYGAALQGPGGVSYSVMLVNSMVKHKLGDNYNQIRRAMESAQSKLGKKLIAPNITVGDLEAIRGSLTQDEFNRARYVIEEVARTKAFVAAVKASSVSGGRTVLELGKLLSQTHNGLSKLLGVSTEELDFIQEFGVKYKMDGNGSGGLPIVAGARMMGGGFGGCVLLFVQSSAVDQFERDVKAAFAAKRFALDKAGNGIKPDVYRVNVGRGAYAKALPATAVSKL